MNINFINFIQEIKSAESNQPQENRQKDNALEFVRCQVCECLFMPEINLYELPEDQQGASNQSETQFFMICPNDACRAVTPFDGQKDSLNWIDLVVRNKKGDSLTTTTQTLPVQPNAPSTSFQQPPSTLFLQLSNNPADTSQQPPFIPDGNTLQQFLNTPSTSFPHPSSLLNDTSFQQPLNYPDDTLQSPPKQFNNSILQKLLTCTDDAILQLPLIPDNTTLEQILNIPGSSLQQPPNQSDQSDSIGRILADLEISSLSNDGELTGDIPLSNKRKRQKGRDDHFDDIED